MSKQVINWLLRGDPSVQYQVKRDLTGALPEELHDLQETIPHKGWCKRLLSYQDKNGLWGGGIYSPKWISTHYTLMLLMRLCLPKQNAQAKKGCKVLLNNGFYDDGGINHFVSLKYGEACVTAMTLALLCYFNIEDERVHALTNFLLGQQMDDGGWNCERPKGAVHSSFHTTISVLEGLLMYKGSYSHKSTEIQKAQKAAHEFLLAHHLFRSDKTGQIVDQKMTRFSFPPRWKYDIMRALDYFREADAPHDPRFCDAITILRKKEKEGKWPLQQKHAGLFFFELEKPGKASRINTLRALRILKWWEKRPSDIDCATT